MSKINLRKLKKQFEDELTDNILNFWVKEVYDPKRKTFFGRIKNSGEKFPDEPLSAVLMTRILWTFSAAYGYYPTAIYKKMADEAYRILVDTFWDNANGGVYWSVKPDGTVVDSKKQFYAEAFCMYALSEYYLAFKVEKAKKLAETMFVLMEKYAYDPEFGGYIEAKTADWKETDDQRLSPKDMDVKKSMNTSLHILEALTNLYRIWKDDSVERQLRSMIRIFLDKIINSQTWHFELFFEKDWTVKSDIDSYGHDIEGSWLLFEAAELLRDRALIDEVIQVSLNMAEVTLKEGIAANGGILYEKEGDKLKEQFDWWPQAESVVGFFNAWQLSKNEKYFDTSLRSWQFIGDYIIDPKKGEWFWGLDAGLNTLPGDKVNAWKCPYHNGRMCMEMMRRIESEINK